MNTEQFDAEAQRLAMVVKRKQEEQNAIERMQGFLVRSRNWRTCLNCDHFREVTVALHTQRTTYKHCTIAKQVPPPEVIVHGCKEWTNDDIPF
jgi:hypothetical protein